MSLIANNPKRRVNPMFQVEQSAAKQQQAQYDSYMYQMNNGQMNNGQIINGQMHHAQQYNQNNNTITPRSTGPIMPGMSQYRTCICPKLKPSQNDARCTCFRPH